MTQSRTETQRSGDAGLGITLPMNMHDADDVGDDDYHYY